MKHTLLLLCFCSTLTLRAQVAPFPSLGMEYGSIYICNMFDCSSYRNSSMRYSGDTVLCGETWSRFRLLPQLLNAIYIRATQGKYYQYVNCSTQALLYDFSKSAGDTVYTGDLGALEVLGTGIFTLPNGEQRKKMEMKSMDPFNPQTYIWVDGIGDIDRAFFRASDFEGGHGQLICLKDSSGLIYANPNPTYVLNCDSLLCPWPVPVFDYTCENMTYHFTNFSKESDTFYWDFGDGESATEMNPTHTFLNPGCYTVRLSAKSDCLPQAYITEKHIAANAPFFWKKSANNIPEPFKTMQFLDAQHGWALGSQTIWKTSDGGVNWDSVPYPGPVRPVGNMHFKDFEHGIIQIYKPGPPYYYSEILWTDNGIDWETQSLAPNPGITALERINDSVAVVAAQYQNVFLTKNRGQTWGLHYPTQGHVSLIEDFEYIGGDTIYFIGINQLLPPYSNTVFGKTFDLSHWTAVEFPGLAYGEQLSFTSAQEGWMSNKNSVYHTTDGGQSWEKQLPEIVTEIEFIDALHGWASGYAGIFGTKDGGLSWEEQACARAGENIRGLNVFSAHQANILMKDGLYEYQEVPDTLKLCETSATTGPLEKQEKLFSIYPNPGSDAIKIRWNGAEYSDACLVLFNAQGRTVLRWQASEHETISIKDLPAGLYFLQAQSKAEKRILMTHKLLIIK